MSDSKHSTIELFSFTASEALLNNESLLNPVLDAVRNSKGARHVYVGKCFDEGETNIRYFFVIWDSYEDHKRLMDDPTTYPQLKKDLSKCCEGDSTVYHIVPKDDPTMVFSAPVTEIARVLVKGDGNAPALKEMFQKWADAVPEAPLAKEYQPFVYGQSRENDNIYFMIGGWATKDHHYKSITTELKVEIGLLADETEHLKVNHCNVREYGYRGQ